MAKQNVQDLSCQFVSFQSTMLENLHALQTEISYLRQWQSDWHKCSKVYNKSNGKKIKKKKPKSSEGLCELKLSEKPKEDFAECHPPSSTAILASFSFTLPPYLLSSLLPIFVDSIIICLSFSFSDSGSNTCI